VLCSCFPCNGTTPDTDLRRPCANSKLTLDVYAQALTPAKRAAHLKLVGLIHPAAETAIGPSWSHAEDAVAVSG
jgi:hypothetical protein